MALDKYDIFISYRRKDSEGKEWGTSIARNIQQALEYRGYKGRVFFDHDEIGPEDFELKILGAIKQCKVFIFVLTKDSLLRCVYENDWVRREIVQAIASNAKIIFINPDNEFNDNYPDDFPIELSVVKKENHIDIRTGSSFKRDMDYVVNEYINPLVNSCHRGYYESESVTVCFRTDLDCRIFNLGEEIGLVKVGEYAKIKLPVGDNILEFVGLECEKDRLEDVYRIETNRQHLFDINLLDKYNSRKKIERMSLPDKEFVEFIENGKYGFKLKNTDEILVEGKYDYAWSFAEGLAPVALRKKVGFIDKSGKEVIPLIYDAVWKFKNGFAKVKLNDKYGCLDKSGNLIIPLEYDNISDSFEYGFIIVEKNKKYGYVDKSGNLVGLKYDYAEPYNELGYARVKLNGNYLVLDKLGREYEFVNGTQIVFDEHKCGYINVSCKQITEIKYEEANYFSCDLALVKLDGKYGYINKTGKEIIACCYDFANHFIDGLALVGFKDNNSRFNEKYGFIDVEGNEIIELKYEKVMSFSCGLALVKLDDKFGFVDTNGRVVVSIIYDYAKSFCDGLALVELDGKFGFVNLTGRVVVPIIYDCAESFSGGLALVKLGGKYGFVNVTGRVVVPIIYDHAESFSEGLALVKSVGKFGFLNKTGLEIVPLKYDYAQSFSEGLAAVGLDGKYGYINSDGIEVINLKYTAAKSFSEGLAGVKFWNELHGYAWGYIDKNGNVVIPAIYDSVSSFNIKGLAVVEDGHAFGCIDKANNIIIPINYLSLTLYVKKYGMIVVTDYGFWYANDQWEVVKEHEYSGIDLMCKERCCYI